MRHPYITASLIAVLSVSSIGGHAVSTAPHLVVNITIDQLRTDYLEAFSPLYKANGFKRLLSEGAVFTNVSFPFIPTDRAAAVASIVTGTSPYYNGITGNRWLDRKTLRPVFCVDDNRYDGIFTTEKSSPAKLTSSTLSDELKISSEGKSIIVSISPFRDAAIISAGHAADGAFWINDDTGLWCSSRFYLQSIPAWLSTFNSQYSPSATIKNIVWKPESTTSDTFNYLTGKRFDRPFKHTFSGQRKYRELKTSGYINTCVTSMALQSATSYGMGNDDMTDMLSVTFYAGNYDGMSSAGGQMELQDTYARLDTEIGRLVSELQKRVGADNVLFILTGTGYQGRENVDYSKYNIPTGTFYINRTANLLNLYFGAIYGQGRYVETCFQNEIYLNHSLFEQKRVSFSDALDRAHEFLLQSEGVKDVYTYNRLMLGEGTLQFAKIRNGYNPDRRGDLLIDVASGWHLVNEDTQENYSVNASPSQFPIIIFGAGTKAEKISTPTSIDRLAPTIAKSIRIRAPNACSSEPLF
jgi:hypothetical protein